MAFVGDSMERKSVKKLGGRTCCQISTNILIKRVGLAQIGASRFFGDIVASLAIPKV
jgi:hypothetical protein